MPILDFCITVMKYLTFSGIFRYTQHTSISIFLFFTATFLFYTHSHQYCTTTVLSFNGQWAALPEAVGSFEAPWLLTEGKGLLIHFHSLPSLRCPPAVGGRGGGMGKERGFMRRSGVSWRDLACWDEIGRGVWHEKQANLWMQATGVWLRWSLQLNQTISDGAARHKSSGMKTSTQWASWVFCEFVDHFFAGFFVYAQPPLLALWPCQLFTTGS